jgi:type II secretory pathway pseudopilin PulG
MRQRLRNGLTIVETLIALGAILILASLILPSAGGARSRALGVQNLTNMRQVGLALNGYAGDWRDRPPAFGPASVPPLAPWAFDFGEYGRGAWFEHQHMYSLALSDYLGDLRVLVAAGNPRPPARLEHAGRSVRFADFLLTNCLYADPAFFNWGTQTGPGQMVVQEMSSALFPSAKGLLWLPVQHHHGRYGPVVSCCTVDVPAPIVFADLSGEEVVMRRLNPGIVNLYDRVYVDPTADPRTMPGTPVANTLDGLRGRDR